jgi:hypothetical protein
LQSLPDEVAFSNWQRAQNHGSLSKEGRAAFYQNARDEVGANRETVTALQKGIYTPTLDALDASPRFAIDAFNTGSVTEKGAVANAKLFAVVKQLGTPDNRQGVDHLAETKFRTAPPELLGASLAQASGVKMTPKEQRTYGHAMTKIRSVVAMRNPALAANMAHYTLGKGKKDFAGLINDETFTTQAVKDMETYKTSAWLANTLNIKPTEVPSTESLFKTPPIKPADNVTLPDANQTLNQIIPLKQPKSKPVHLEDMQKRYFEGDEKQW